MTIKCNALVGDNKGTVCGKPATRRLPPECTRYGSPGLCEQHWRVQLWAAKGRAAEENALVTALESATRIEVPSA